MTRAAAAKQGGGVGERRDENTEWRKLEGARFAPILDAGILLWGRGLRRGEAIGRGCAKGTRTFDTDADRGRRRARRARRLEGLRCAAPPRIWAGAKEAPGARSWWRTRGSVSEARSRDAAGASAKVGLREVRSAAPNIGGGEGGR